MNVLKTVEQAAGELNVSVHTIRAWIARRKIGHVRLGRAVRIPAAEIVRLIERGTVPALPERARRMM
jgi:excisionase family DNA binding protein